MKAEADDERRSDGTWRGAGELGAASRARRCACGRRANGDDDHIGCGVSLCGELNQSGTHARAVTGEVVTACSTRTIGRGRQRYACDQRTAFVASGATATSSTGALALRATYGSHET
jgi:hypothetical protein